MPLPPGIRAAKTPDEPGRWRPTSGELESLPLLMRVEVRGGRRACVVQVLLVADARPPCPRPPSPPTQEDSDTCTRIVLAYVGWLNLRGLTMHYWDASGERYRSTRDCACGGCMGCPSELVMWQGSTQLGKAVEDQNCGNWCTRCCQACCLCTMFTKVRGERRAVGVFTRAHARACAHRTAPSATPPPPPRPHPPLATGARQHGRPPAHAALPPARQHLLLRAREQLLRRDVLQGRRGVRHPGHGWQPGGNHPEDVRPLRAGRGLLRR